MATPLLFYAAYALDARPATDSILHTPFFALSAAHREELQEMLHTVEKFRYDSASPFLTFWTPNGHFTPLSPESIATSARYSVHMCQLYTSIEEARDEIINAPIRLTNVIEMELILSDDPDVWYAGDDLGSITNHVTEFSKAICADLPCLRVLTFTIAAPALPDAEVLERCELNYFQRTANNISINLNYVKKKQHGGLTGATRQLAARPVL